MSNEEPALTTRRTPRQGAGGSPVGSTLSIILAIVAVVAGFLILRNITDDGSNSDAVADELADDTSATTVPGDTDGDGVPDIEIAVTTTTTTSTTVPLVTTGATVIVANANSVGGSAGAMTTALEFAEFTLADPVNATGPDLADSIVYYEPGVAGALDVANSVARVMGGLSVLEVVTPAPTESGSLNGAGVLVMLGDNQAGRTLEDLQAEAAADAPAAEAPAPAGGDDAATTTAAPADQ